MIASLTQFLTDRSVDCIYERQLHHEELHLVPSFMELLNKGLPSPCNRPSERRAQSLARRCLLPEGT
jgi:hypothetical protein